MKSDSTFQAEYEALKDVPDVFYTDPFGGNGPSGVVTADRYRAGTSDFPGELTDAPLMRVDAAPRAPLDLGAVAAVSNAKARTDIVEWLQTVLGLDVDAAWQAVGADPGAAQRVAAGVAALGIEYYATYLPFHQYANSSVTPWGMYFNIREIFEGARRMADLARKEGVEITSDAALRLAFFIPYRHELFHHHVERFAFRQEVLLRRAIYKPYDFGVFRRTARSSRWLEEALAQAVVLDSRFVQSHIGIERNALRRIIERAFDEMPPGYRDYRCEAFGGTDKAHQLFAAQIMTATEHPGYAATSLALPKNEYGVDPRTVPGYLTDRTNFIGQFQFATPEMRKVKAWMEGAGYRYEGPGPGDHERWRHVETGKIVQLNKIGKDCDLASLKAVARVSNVKVYDLNSMIRAC